MTSDDRVRELRKQVSGIVYLRNKLTTERESKLRELAEVLIQLPIALDEGADEVALVLIQVKDACYATVRTLTWELSRIGDQARRVATDLRALHYVPPEGTSLEADAVAMDRVVVAILAEVGQPSFPPAEETPDPRAQLDALKRKRRTPGGGGTSGAPAARG